MLNEEKKGGWPSSVRTKTISWLFGGLLTGLIVNYVYELNKDTILKSSRWIFQHSAVVKANNGHDLFLKADTLSQSGKREDAQLAYNLAMEELSSAATDGIPSAMRDLGRLLCKGRRGYIKKDTAQAKVWLGKASEAGEADARTILMSGCQPDER